MKTRILSLLLVLVMAVGMLASCGGGGGGGGGDTCTNHVDANHDQKCDNAGCTADVPCPHNWDEEGVCEWCDAIQCVAHVDRNHDQKCDICKEAVACSHGADANVDSKCDYCGAAFSCALPAHSDGNQDGLCDGCRFLLDDTKFPWESGTLTFEMTQHSNMEELPSGCQNWMAGESTTGSSLTQAAAKERNEKAFEVTKLNISYKYLPDGNTDYSWSKNYTRIQTNQDKGQYSDMYCNFVYDLIGAYLLGCFANLKTEKYTNYFAFAKNPDYGTEIGDSEGYMYEYMTSLSIKEDKMYVLASDYFIDLVRAFYVVPVNVTMLEDLETELPNNPTDFAAMVSAGDWTYEKVIQYSAGYGDVTASADDKKGFALAEHSLSAAGILYTTSVRLLNDARKQPGSTFVSDGTNSPYSYSDTNETLRSFSSALGNMVTKPGVVRFKDSDKASFGSNLLNIRNQFTTNKVLFGGVILLGSLEYLDYQSMKTRDGKGFLVVPVPLYTDTEVYSTQIHNVGRIGAISVMSEKFAECSAFLNYQSTHSRDVKNTYYEQELLYSVVGGGNTDKALLDANKEMLDLLRDSLITGFDKAYEDSSALFDNGTMVTMPSGGEKLYKDLKWHDIFWQNNYEMGSLIDSYYSSLKPAKEAGMKALFNDGNTMLPE
ncbi:MAG: hypothetical protein IJW11_07670 [Clostridia bacterium]|nr:hypothetical protein [Clostridia bacterium]MBQ7407613.1 hypothetical protein [Clostridia bacterium]